MPVFEFLLDDEIHHVRADGWRLYGAQVVFFDGQLDLKTGASVEQEVGHFVIGDPQRNITLLEP